MPLEVVENFHIFIFCRVKCLFWSYKKEGEREGEESVEKFVVMNNYIHINTLVLLSRDAKASAFYAF